MRRRVYLLAAVHVAVAALIGAFAWNGGLFQIPSPVAAAFAVGFGLVGLLPVHVEIGRHAISVTLVEAVLVAALLVLGVPAVVLAAVAGEVFACLLQRQRPLKVLFNGTAAMAATTVASVAFALAPGADATEPVAWLSALAAVVAYGFVNHVSTSLVIATVEGRSFVDVMLASMAPSAVATVVSGSIGLAAVVLHSAAPAAPLLVAPLVVLMVVETRRLAAHRAEHLRFERLYAASSRTGGLQGTIDVLATLAAEARTLVSGDSGLCLAQDRAGKWFGVIVDDTGSRPADDDAVRALVVLSNRRGQGEISAEEVPALLRHALPSAASIVVSRSSDSAAAPVVIAALRVLGTDESSDARAEVLDAFVGHAALIVANAHLYEDVEQALAHQVDLNRQKDDFVAVVSHELRTPLTAMIGSMSTIKRMDHRLTTDRRATLVEIALRQGNRLQRLIEDLLLLATVESSRQVTRLEDEVILRDLVGDIVSDISEHRRDHAAPNVQFETLGLPALRTDEQKLRQVLTNLIENACKYAPESPIRVRATAAGDWLDIDVIDRGPGISEKDRHKVFERFVQLDQSSTRSQGGTGLGLYLCRQLSGLLGGSLTLSDTPGGGACFTLRLPNTLTTAAPEAHFLEIDADQVGELVASAGGEAR